MTTDIGQHPPQNAFAACHATIYTTELLERILYETTDCPIGTTTLLLSQRVCQKFRNVIRNFKPLQEELFFRSPPHTASSSSADDFEDPIPHLNPFLSQPRNANNIPFLSDFGLSLSLTIPVRLNDGIWRNMRLFRSSEEVLIYVRDLRSGAETVVEGKEDMTVHEIILKL